MRGLNIIIFGMYIMPLSIPQKVGVVFYGLAAGVCAVVATAAASVILGVLVEVFLRLTQPAPPNGGGWLVLGAAIDGFYVGIVVGAIVCWRVCRSRLRRVPTE